MKKDYEAVGRLHFFSLFWWFQEKIMAQPWPVQWWYSKTRRNILSRYMVWWSTNIFVFVVCLVLFSLFNKVWSIILFFNVQRNLVLLPVLPVALLFLVNVFRMQYCTTEPSMYQSIWVGRCSHENVRMNKAFALGVGLAWWLCYTMTHRVPNLNFKYDTLHSQVMTLTPLTIRRKQMW